VGAALFAGEDRLIDHLGQFLVRGQDHRPARPADGLVGGEGSHVGDADRVGVDSGGGHPGGVGDIGHQVGSHLISDGAERLPIWGPGVGGVAGDDHPWPVFPRQVADGLVVKPFGLRINAIGNHPVSLAGDVEL